MVRWQEGFRDADTLEDGAVLQILGPEDVAASGHDHGVVTGKPETLRPIEPAVVRLDRDRSNGDSCACRAVARDPRGCCVSSRHAPTAPKAAPDRGREGCAEAADRRAAAATSSRDGLGPWWNRARRDGRERVTKTAQVSPSFIDRTEAELEDDKPYKMHLVVAAPASATKDAAWPKRTLELESLVETFWKQFGPGIECAGVEVFPTSALTLADIEKYQRFDADWVSFADDSPATPHAADMKA
jgi:hypothetical protein